MRAPSINYFMLVTSLDHLADAPPYSTDTMPMARILPRPETDINATSYDVRLSDAPVLTNYPHPTMLTVACTGNSPSSSMSVLTTPRTKTRRSLRRDLAIGPIDDSVASTLLRTVRDGEFVNTYGQWWWYDASIISVCQCWLWSGFSRDS